MISSPLLSSQCCSTQTKQTKSTEPTNIFDKFDADDAFSTSTEKQAMKPSGPVRRKLNLKRLNLQKPSKRSASLRGSDKASSNQLESEKQKLLTSKSSTSLITSPKTSLLNIKTTRNEVTNIRAMNANLSCVSDSKVVVQGTKEASTTKTSDMNKVKSDTEVDQKFNDFSKMDEQSLNVNSIEDHRKPLEFEDNEKVQNPISSKVINNEVQSKSDSKLPSVVEGTVEIEGLSQENCDSPKDDVGITESQESDTIESTGSSDINRPPDSERITVSIKIESRKSSEESVIKIHSEDNQEDNVETQLYTQTDADIELEPLTSDGSDSELVADGNMRVKRNQSMNDAPIVISSDDDQEGTTEVLPKNKGKTSVKPSSFDEPQPRSSHPFLTPEELKLMDPLPNRSSDESDADLVIDERPNKMFGYGAVKASMKSKELPKKQDYRSKFKIKKKTSSTDKPIEKSAGKVAPKVQAKNKMIEKSDRPPLLATPSPIERSPSLRGSDKASSHQSKSFQQNYSKPTSCVPQTPPFNTFNAPGPSGSQVPPPYYGQYNSYPGAPQYNPHSTGPPVFNQPPQPMYDMHQQMQNHLPFYNPMPGPYAMAPEQPHFFPGSFQTNQEIPVAGQHSKDPRVKALGKPTDPRAQPSNSKDPRVKSKFKEAPIVQSFPTSSRVLMRPPLKRKPVKTLPMRKKTAIDSSSIKFKCYNKVVLPDFKEKVRRGVELTDQEQSLVKNYPKDFQEEPKTKFNFKVVSSFIFIFCVHFLA